MTFVADKVHSFEFCLHGIGWNEGQYSKENAYQKRKIKDDFHKRFS
jgi:hypothetical protein